MKLYLYLRLYGAAVAPPPAPVEGTVGVVC
jgi:hypothetical protein